MWEPESIALLYYHQLMQAEQSPMHVSIRPILTNLCCQGILFCRHTALTAVLSSQPQSFALEEVLSCS